MKKFAIISNKDTKECFVGTGTNEDFYKSIKMELLEVEQAYNGKWYLAGYAPVKSQNEIDYEQVEQDLTASEKQIDKIKNDFLTAQLLDDVDTQNELKEQYITLLTGGKNGNQE